MLAVSVPTAPCVDVVYMIVTDPVKQPDHQAHVIHCQQHAVTKEQKC